MHMFSPLPLSDSPQERGHDGAVVAEAFHRAYGPLVCGDFQTIALKWRVDENHVPDFMPEDERLFVSGQLETSGDGYNPHKWVNGRQSGVVGVLQRGARIQRREQTKCLEHPKIVPNDLMKINLRS
jgi:hypothetical protein